MIGILKKYLDKLGLKDFTELTDEERVDYDKWYEVLSKEVTVESTKEFAEQQIVELQKDLKRYVREGKDREALFATAKLDNYEALLEIMDEPNRTRENLEGYIKNLIDEN